MRRVVGILMLLVLIASGCSDQLIRLIRYKQYERRHSHDTSDYVVDGVRLGPCYEPDTQPADDDNNAAEPQKEH